MSRYKLCKLLRALINRVDLTEGQGGGLMHLLLGDDRFEADELEPVASPESHNREVLDLAVIELSEERPLHAVDVVVIFFYLGRH